jgi:radical SAM superfamily enzyme YgiQ (UPF0313 family)
MKDFPIMQFTKRLKIVPEHINNKEQGTNKNLVPYIVAAHPGSTKEDMKEMNFFCDDNNLFVKLTQVFTPTPGTLSTAMHWTGTWYSNWDGYETELVLAQDGLSVEGTYSWQGSNGNILSSWRK